jgi:hypothetical protein
MSLKFIIRNQKNRKQLSPSPPGERFRVRPLKKGLLSACRRIAILWELQPKEKTLHPPAASVGSFYFQPSLELARLGLKIKSPGAFAPGLFLCSGGRIRTSDLWVMSPTSYHCSTPQFYGCKCNIYTPINKFILHFLVLVFVKSL